MREGQWEDCEPADEEDCGGFTIVDALPVLVNVSQDEQFFSLDHGESTVAYQYRIEHMIPKEAKSGDRFRFELRDDKIDWWDWGRREEPRKYTGLRAMLAARFSR